MSHRVRCQAPREVRRWADIARRAVLPARQGQAPLFPSRGGRRALAGQTLFETAIAFPLLLLLAVALVQFALVIHARHVVIGAAQDGARVAAAYDSSLAAGVRHSEEILWASLGPSAEGFTARPGGSGDVVIITVEGHYRLFIPWVTDGTIPLRAEAISQKEVFRVGR